MTASDVITLPVTRIAVIVSLLIQTGALVWFAAKLDSRVHWLETVVATHDQELDKRTEIIVRFNKVEADVQRLMRRYDRDGTALPLK